jgi:hypothetical protein
MISTTVHTHHFVGSLERLLGLAGPSFIKLYATYTIALHIKELIGNTTTRAIANQ